MPRTPHNKYPQDQVDAALDIYTHQGPRAAGRAVGVSPSTVTRWAQQAGLAGTCNENKREAAAKATEARRLTWAQAKPEVVTKLAAVIDRLLDRADKADDARDVRNLIFAFAIAVDKAQLLSGAPTERIEGLSAEERAAQMLVARDELAAAREKRTGS